METEEITEGAVFDVSVSCKGLRALDTFSHSDPLCVLHSKTGLRGAWTEVGRTESVKNTGDPEWQRSFNLTYHFHQKQSLRFSIFDIDSSSSNLSDHDNLGSAECSLAQILAAPNNELVLPLSPHRHKVGDCGELVLRAVEISDGTRDRVTLDLTAQSLDKKDLFSESDPFYCVYRTNDDNTGTLVYRSEWISNTASPDWAPVTMDCAKLCMGDWTRTLRIEVYDWDFDGGHDFIGSCTTNLEELSQGEEFQIMQFDLINPKKKEKKGYKNSGQIVVKSVKIVQDSTFLDYVRGGLRINLCVAVDMTGGEHPDPLSPSCLHHLDPRTGENVYTTAIRTVGEILQDYDYDKKILGLGFGSQVGGMVRHCFPLNDNPRSPYCRGLEGLLESYTATLNTVTLAEPTVYSEVLEFAANDSLRAGSETEYTVILLITDGGITDLEQTKQVLVKLSRLPISVVLVGVGRGDMSHLIQLDSDRARLCAGNTQAVRDIVQFVDLREKSSDESNDLNQYIPGCVLDPAQLNHELEAPESRYRLARAVLQEIPRQVVEYMKKNGISPRVADIPDDL